MTDKRICTHCKIEQEEDRFQWVGDRRRNQCNKCRWRQRKARNKTYEISVTEKECFACKRVLPADSFYPQKRMATGLATNCKECDKAKSNKRYAPSAEKIKKRANEYYYANKEKVTAYNREYRKKYQQNPMVRLARRLRNRLYYALRKTSWKKNTHFAEYIGCDLETLKQHITSLFTDGMTWELLMEGKIHLDHIVPLASATTEEELYKLCHFENIQPMWAVDNIRKGCKVA